ncbi:hypothetical protein [Mycobacteroides franklinii]|uniref:Intersectin-EH binding protein Ibp1 n=1 Tax=Mycobacteroides franklinii TaxID=948102 RepID=A0A4R8RCK7_9MYCO|nr:hypothetical protein [Mycobacteroides franklinii]ORA58273.1 hypothetical protein BST24_22465 [Mycobacteroides franklinii]TDH24836.1 hypothetical protein EJ571_02815 [Mycobacteroides franklinii]TDZ42851.1 hypothetical protein CCUG64054_02900 [Mycobacteroides franklinii]TDZ53000.1 hypothetical protein CCUG63697_01486 [Mycobacteroides franklinii]TDZ56406.1 hypothetical protein CCUG63696_02902 [Mycobacteroides franklinii]
MNKLVAAVVGGVGVAVSTALLSAPIALAGPTPPPHCYGQETSVNEIDHRPCVTPGGSAYQQGANQPTYEGANPLVPLGTNPHVPYGTNKINPTLSPSPDNA